MQNLPYAQPAPLNYQRPPIYYAPSVKPVPRSYLNAAVLTLILYFVGFGIVGTIVNFVYLASAKNEEARTGSQPEGKGRLVAMIWVFFWIPLIVGVIFLVIMLASSASSSG